MKLSPKDKNILLKFLRDNILMSVSTSGVMLWSANVYYVADDDLNLYFLSSPTSKHSQNIANNSEVCCAIAKSDQKISDKKIGMQINGTCHSVKGIKYIKVLIDAFAKSRHNLSLPTLSSFKNAARSGIYVVKPIHIRFFNEELYKDDSKEFTVGAPDNNVVKWMNTLALAWTKRNPELIASILDKDVKYFEDPFKKPQNYHETVSEWKNIEKNQKDIRFQYYLLSKIGSTHLVQWEAEYKKMTDDKTVNLSGIFKITLKENGKCTEFHQWYNLK